MRIKHLLLATIILLSFTQISLSYESTSFDTSLTAGIEPNYQESDTLLFTQIVGPYEDLNLNTKEYLDTLYYYCITKLKLTKIPFHYAIDENGDIFETQNYDAIKLTDGKNIVIAYLSADPQLSNKASEAVKELAETLSYQYGIGKYEVKNYQIESSENALSKLSLTEPNEIFLSSIDNTLKDWNMSEVENLEYKAEIVSVEYEKEIEIGSRLNVKITVKNLNDFVWTSNRYPIYISVKDDNESIFAVNGEWDSFSKPLSIGSDQYVLPDSTIELSFNIDPKVLPGTYSETLLMYKFSDSIFENSEFNIEFNVVKGDNTLVEMYSPEYGFVNIRECTYFSCEKIETANDGEVYVVIEQQDAWYKISYGQDKEGWVYVKYAREI